MSWFRHKPTIKDHKPPVPSKKSPASERLHKEIKEAVRTTKKESKKS